MALTDEQIRDALPGYLLDGDGLYLQVSKSGAKSWIYRFQINGKRREMGLGSLSEVTVVEARSRAKEARAIKANAIDPIDARSDKSICSFCMYWDDPETHESGAIGICRRYPPVPGVELVVETPFGDAVQRPAFPETRDKDWCGEYIHRKY